MNKLANIDLDTIKAFVKANPLLCILVVLDIALFFIAFQQDNASEALEEKISSYMIKEKQIKANLSKLTGMERDFDSLKAIKTTILKKCINFGKKITIYNFLKQIDSFLLQNKLTVSNTQLYDINQNRNINFNQDLEEFDGDSVIASYNVFFTGSPEDLLTFLNKLNELPYFTNLQKLELRNNTSDKGVALNVNLSFSMLGKVQLKEQ
ncbi:MAG: hypothetical protein ACSW8C_00165 [bacterium]